MPNDTLQIEPIGGVDYETSEDKIQPGKVRVGNNVLFERGECINRPLMSDIHVTGTTSYPMWIDSFSVPGAVYTLMGTNDGKLWSINLTTGNATEITGAGVGWAYPMSSAVVNGVVLITSNSGIVRWVPAAASYTIISVVKPKFITGHLSRAVGAYTQASNGSINVVWSIAGDETVWTGSTNGSGSSFLTEADDEFMNIKTVHNVLCILRRSGIHLGYSTGVAIPAYRFELYSREDIGVLISESVAKQGNILYFIGTDNVYAFDTAELTPIGKDVRTQLIPNAMTLANLGGFYRGFITRGFSNGKPRARYHLVPCANGATLDTHSYPHYTYDIDSGAWSSHTYNRLSYGFQMKWNTINQTAAVLHDGGTLGTGIYIGYWDPAQACEQAATVTLPNQVVGSQEMDVLVERILLRLRDYGFTGAADSPTITVSTTLGKVVTSWTAIFDYTLAVNDGLWKRWWADCKTSSAQAGNDVVVSISFPSGKKFSMDWLGIKWGQSGNLRK